ncbi:MAG: T9SS type A sorting domain-containing protein [Candidatus Hatepunaea meridiana]|nr:T9SS type A sorting domain-containing protein [Candidatus Hatepunaea meridiana]
MNNSRMIVILLAVLVSVSAIYSSENNAVKGITTQLPTYQCVSEDPASVHSKSDDITIARITKISPIQNIHRLGADDWRLLDSCQNKVSIPPGDSYAIRLNLPRLCIEENLPELYLDDEWMEAVERVPAWLRTDLINNLSKISGDVGEFAIGMACDAILDADDAHVDEVAFAIAHFSPRLLQDLNVDFGLFLENAEGIYAADEYLDYVNIVEHGDIEEDDDYWTTLEYIILNEDGEAEEVEIDRDIYYWYVVHPRLSDESPRYIDPNSGSARQPPNGVFWRDFLLNHPDDDYTSLREYLEDCEFLWAGLRNNISEENGAIGAVSRWIQHSLEFTSRQERPIQPVRIYRMHIGRCGEHSDMTAAAGRAALIPTLCTSTYCTDHTWNEFWGGDRWVVLEPVNGYVDHAPYDNWNQLPAVFNWRSDASVWTVTDCYTEYSILNISVTGRHNNPVDGAKIMLASNNLQDGLSPCTWGYTNSDGEVSFTIGDSINIYYRVESELGNFPSEANRVSQIIANSSADQVYTQSQRMNETMPNVSPDDAEMPDDPTNNWHLAVSYDLPVETVNGIIFSNAEFFQDVGSSKLDFFICDEQNYEEYLDGDDFEAFSADELTEAGEIEFTFPTDDVWYAVFSNANHVANYMRVDMEAMLYVDSEVRIALEPEAPASYSLHQNYPNPFNSSTSIQFDIGRNGATQLIVYDLTGHKLHSQDLGNLSAGQHEVTLNGKNLTSGLYLYEVTCNGFIDRKTMVLLK